MAASGRLGRTAIVATVVGAVLCMVAIVIWNAPANWLALELASRTHGVLLLADARGTVWSGSAVLALGTPRTPGTEAGGDPGGDPSSVPADGARLALPGRITWTLEIDRSLAPVLHLTHDGILLARPVTARFQDGGLTVDAGAVTLPASMLRLAGAPLNTLLPEGRCELQWNGLRFDDAGRAVGDGTLRISSFALAISPVRPLGDYRVTWSSAATGVTWQLATERGPLELQGAGSITGRRPRARVAVRVARDATPALAAQLNPLLDMLGRRGSNEAIVETGGRS